MEKERAFELFNRIKAEGQLAIQSFVLDRRAKSFS
jgi:hypothetical protein